jgi:hypothetical protein
VALVTGPLLAGLGITAIGAGIGATYGGIFGSLIGMGIGEEDVHRYLEGIRRGETLVAVKPTLTGRPKRPVFCASTMPAAS